MSQDVMTVEEVAAYLSVAPDTIYDKVSTRDIPFMKLGNLLRFPRPAIDQWLLENTFRPLPSFYDELARSAGRWLFMKWLESRGVDYRTVGAQALSTLAGTALAELREKPSAPHGPFDRAADPEAP